MTVQKSSKLDKTFIVLFQPSKTSRLGLSFNSSSLQISSAFGSEAFK
jgi:preprotein translocase subunit SecG